MHASCAKGLQAFRLNGLRACTHGGPGGALKTPGDEFGVQESGAGAFLRGLQASQGWLCGHRPCLWRAPGSRLLRK